MQPETVLNAAPVFIVTPYVIIYIISFAVCLVVAGAAWMRREAEGGLLLFFMMVSAAVWSFFGIFEVSATSWEVKILFSKLEYIGGVTLPVVFLLFIASHVGLGKYITRRNMLLLFIIPAVTLVLAATNEYHHLIWLSFSAGPEGSNLIMYEHGPWFWFSNIGYSSLCVLAGSVLLVGFAISSHRKYQPRTFLMLVGGLLPWLMALIYVSSLNPLPGYDLTRVGFSFSGALFLLAVVRWQLLDLVPVARSRVMDTIRDGIIVVDKRNVIIDINPAAVKMLGSSNGSLIGKSLAKLAEEISWLAPLTAIGIDSPGITLITDSAIHLETETYPVIEGRGKVKARIFTLLDITDRVKAEAEKQAMINRLEVSTRLATLGEMAAGIAHEINNPLTAIIGFSELLMQEDLPAEAAGHVKYIAEGSNRVKDIVKRMLIFARQDKSIKLSIDIHDVIEKTLEMRQYVLNTSNIEVVKNYDPDLPPVTVDPGQMQQVFLNLIVNAEYVLKDIPAPARLTIITSHSAGNVRITFMDNGPGMPPEVLNRLFHPFFTTKSPGEGTGLGLSLSRSIVLEHGGDIQARSEVGKGSWFTVKLPVEQTQKPSG
ncbi:MAG: PAS domain S-box protein [Dehalococcoidaceae bacterium]|nr:PAS domain S-box protein [Dehalococcoidaceae bacterium]